ncbi:MAG: hydantoinase/oxoprolinase family protein [Anaerolineales bacterium]
MTIALGIDTGGTYTDAVLVREDTGEVLHSAKALTTRWDLAIGIGEAISAVLDSGAASPSDVSLVALSTTLATNAIVEGQGSPACLVLIGYDRDLMREFGFEGALVTPDVVYVRGGHNAVGDEMAPLDEEALREAVASRIGRVAAFAVSGYFAARNPTHELRARALIEEMTARASEDGRPLPVTCGHELSVRLNAVRRATTAALNARLIPLLQDLIATVQRTLAEHGVSAPLMVVKGDGSLVRAEWAMRRPVETILSGPAASAVGAWHLAGRQDVWVVDVGGTTTDIAALRGGRPHLNPEGARVGQWQTMVEAVDVRTTGLGGDSLVRLDGERRLHIGPGRVVPLCLLASQYPEVLAELERDAAADCDEPWVGQFALAHGRAGNALSDEEAALLRSLERGPRPLTALLGEGAYPLVALRRLERLEAMRLVMRAGFTPTDALHVLGRFRRWDGRASLAGARILAARLGCSPEAFCERVVAEVSERVARELVAKVMGDEGIAVDWTAPVVDALFARAAGNGGDSSLGCRLYLREPLVGIGAPAEAYMPRVAELLHTDLIIPRHADVANAVGAVAGGVVQRWRVMVQPLPGGEAFRAHLPDGVRDFPTVEDAVAYAERAVPAALEAAVRRAGAAHVEVHVAREDRVAVAQAGWGQEIYLCTELTFTAAGRPSPAR